MKPRMPDRYVLALYAADMMATLLSLALAQWLRETLPYGQPFVAVGGGLNLVIYMMAFVIWTATLRQFRAYDLNRILRVVDEMQVVWTSVCVSTLLLAGILYFSYRGVSRLLFVYSALLAGFLTALFRLVLRGVFKLMRGQRMAVQRILLVGAGDLGRRMAELLDDRRWMGLHVVGFVDDDAHKLHESVAGFPVLGTLDEARDLADEYAISELIIALPNRAYTRLEQITSDFYDTQVNVRVVPDLFSLAYLRTSLGVVGDLPVITLKEPVLSDTMLLAKRAMDVVAAAIAILLLWPVLLTISVAIKLDSSGPVLYKSQRVGWHGQLFQMLKFRTMIPDAHAQEALFIDQTEDGRRFLRKGKDDPRLTRVGKHLRRWSLDELPQFFNVLRGEMSLVGPRPELPSLVQHYEPWQRKRFSVAPGITGWWQITGRSDRPSSLHVEEDLHYIRNYSLLLDLQILLRTIGVVIHGQGAY